MLDGGCLRWFQDHLSVMSLAILSQHNSLRSYRNIVHLRFYRNIVPLAILSQHSLLAILSQHTHCIDRSIFSQDLPQSHAMATWRPWQPVIAWIVFVETFTPAGWRFTMSPFFSARSNTTIADAERWIVALDPGDDIMEIQIVQGSDIIHDWLEDYFLMCYNHGYFNGDPIPNA